MGLCRAIPNINKEGGVTDRNEEDPTGRELAHKWRRKEVV